MQQDAPLELAPRRPQLLGTLGDADCVALQPLDRPFGQDHPVARDLAQLVKLNSDRLLAAACTVKGNHLAAVDVVLAHRRTQFSQ